MSAHLEPPDDCAMILAKEALEQVRRLEELASFAGADATEAQVLTISLAIRSAANAHAELLAAATEASHRLQYAIEDAKKDAP